MKKTNITKKVLVLGVGLVGKFIAEKLLEEYDVTALDKNINNLNFLDKRIKFIIGDVFSMKEEIFSTFDIIVGALPGSVGFKAANKILGMGKDYVDISFSPEDMLTLDKLAKEKGSRCIVDFGVAPGLSHLLYGYHKNILKEVTNYKILVGGLLDETKTKSPWSYKTPWGYKAPFSPADVIEEYTRPARFVKDGKVVTLPALSELEIFWENSISYEAFLTDGVRTLLSENGNNVSIVEKTIRPSGYSDKIRILLSSGFFSNKPIKVNGEKVIPMDITTKLLIDSWKMGEDDRDMTLMKILVEGIDHLGHKTNKKYKLFDTHDGTYSSMARTTGSMCVAGVKLLDNGLLKDSGIFTPEKVGEDMKCFDFIINYLKKHKINLQKDF